MELLNHQCCWGNNVPSNYSDATDINSPTHARTSYQRIKMKMYEQGLKVKSVAGNLFAILV